MHLPVVSTAHVASHDMSKLLVKVVRESPELTLITFDDSTVVEVPTRARLIGNPAGRYVEQIRSGRHLGIDDIHPPRDAGDLAAELISIMERIPPSWGRWIDVDPGWYPLVIDTHRKLLTVDPDCGASDQAEVRRPAILRRSVRQRPQQGVGGHHL